MKKLINVTSMLSLIVSMNTGAFEINWKEVKRNHEVEKFLKSKEVDIFRPWYLSKEIIDEVVNQHDFEYDLSRIKTVNVVINIEEYERAKEAADFFPSFTMVSATMQDESLSSRERNKVAAGAIINGSAYSIARINGVEEGDAKLIGFISGFIAGLLNDGVRTFGYGDYEYDNFSYSAAGPGLVNINFRFEI